MRAILALDTLSGDFEMFKIYSALVAFFRSLAEPAPAPDPMASFTPREWADLPVHHPWLDRG